LFSRRLTVAPIGMALLSGSLGLNQ